MRKDIEIPEVKDIYIAAIKEWDDDFLSQNWNVYLINNSRKDMEATIVVSRGSDADRKTATLRHGLGTIPAQTTRKIEFIAEEVLPFKNEFLLTFFAEGKLYDRTYVFEPNTIKEDNIKTIPLLENKAVLAT
tara:strand:- start:94321 stop:94716 length:396 start_codon:yes stop_codon:yes gene_type:complete